MERAREVRRGGARTEKGRGESGNIGMLGRRQVTPRWEDDTVWRHNGSGWRECRVRRGMLPPVKSSDGGKKGRGGSIINT